MNANRPAGGPTGRRGPAARLESGALLAEVEAIRTTVHETAQAIFGQWHAGITERAFLPASRNLADYLALRRLDLSDLQSTLAMLGLSSLGRSEAHVRATLDALCATLSRLAGAGAPPYPPAGAFSAGRHALDRAQRGLFGTSPGGPKTRIMVTLPTEAASDVALVRGLVDAGMTCARINCAHDDAATWQAMAGLVRTIAAEAKRECRILMDIGGPKCRIETVHAADRVRLFCGDRMALVRAVDDAEAKDTVTATITFPDILAKLVTGAEVWINEMVASARASSRPIRIAWHWKCSARGARASA